MNKTVDACRKMNISTTYTIFQAKPGAIVFIHILFNQCAEMVLHEDVNIIVAITNALVNSYGCTFDSRYDVLLNDINEGS